MIGKSLFILFAIVLPLAALGALIALAFWAFGGQGACFVPPLIVVYLGVLLVAFEVQRRAGLKGEEEGEREGE